MSKYLPHAAVVREQMQHLRRLNYGLKVGTHVRYPDADKGPYILKKSVVEKMQIEQAASIVKEAIKQGEENGGNKV